MESIIRSINEQTRLALTSSRPLFHARIEVGSHVVKKNSKTIKNRRTKSGAIKPYIGNTQRQASAQDFLVLELRRRAADICLDKPIHDSVWAMLLFFYPNSQFFTQRGQINRKLPDLSNLYELPQDALQKAGILKNDSQIMSHDLSRKLPSGDENFYLEIFLLEYDEKWELEKWNRSVPLKP